MREIYHNNVCYLQFDIYQPFPQMLHGVFTRLGGYSEAPYTGLNMSSPVHGRGDNYQTVVRNRQVAMEALNLANAPCASIWQIHGADIVRVDRQQGTWRTDWQSRSSYEVKWEPEAIHQGDSLVSAETDIALEMSFADCVPITFYDPIKQVISIAHGGWRGTARGVVLATIEAMQQHFDCQVQDIYAGIGPAIGPCCYEVSQQVQAIFLGQEEFDTNPTRQEYRGLVRESAVFSIVQLEEKESLRLDLQATNKKQLQMIGLLDEHIEIMRICTGCHTDRFFSHRMEQGNTGRFGVILCLQSPVG